MRAPFNESGIQRKQPWEIHMFRHLIAIVFALFTLSAFAAGVDANSASRADLETVKGIGPGLSGKIIEARKAGNFKDWSDLVDRVGGIGPGNAAKFSQAGLTVGGAAYEAKAAAKPAAKKEKKEKAEKTEKAGKPASM
jgi:competence protein ComEA